MIDKKTYHSFFRPHGKMIEKSNELTNIVDKISPRVSNFIKNIVINLCSEPTTLDDSKNMKNSYSGVIAHPSKSFLDFPSLLSCNTQLQLPNSTTV